MIDLKKSKLARLTNDSLDEFWSERHHIIKYQFGLHLNQYATGKMFDYNHKLNLSNEQRQTAIESYRKTHRSSSISKQFQRLLIGYYGVRGLTPKKVNLSSKIANSIKNPKNCTSDHIIGVTLCSEYVIQIFRQKMSLRIFNTINEPEDPFKNLKDDSIYREVINEMCNDWLKDHLWLWAMCRVTKKEHSPANGGIRRDYEFKDDLTLEIKYRANLGHYDDAGVEIQHYE